MRRPASGESAEFYQKYINRVPGEDFLAQLTSALGTTTQALEALTDEQWDHRYAPGKWSLKESWIHVIDTERVMMYRALRVARNDQTPMPGFDQDTYVPNSEAENRTPASIIEEYRLTRMASMAMLKHFSAEMLGRMGTASNAPISARALGFIIAGHELHHIALMEEKYLA